MKAVRISSDRVVSYRNSTSNHNMYVVNISESLLYLIEILHQTTTIDAFNFMLELLYLIEILHQTTTLAGRHITPTGLYLIEILHQTTTANLPSYTIRRCILSKFYIKPQRSGSYVPYMKCCILSKFYIKPQRRASY